jgi:hypothetical protein
MPAADGMAPSGRLLCLREWCGFARASFVPQGHASGFSEMASSSLRSAAILIAESQQAALHLGPEVYGQAGCLSVNYISSARRTRPFFKLDNKMARVYVHFLSCAASSKKQRSTT